MAAGGADRAGYSGLKLLASSPPSQVDKAVAAGSAEETFSDAQVAFDAASSELVMLGDTLKTANTRLAAAQAASDMADAQYQTAKTAHDMAMAAYDADPVNPDLGPALDEARLNLDEAVEQQVNLQNTVEKVSTAQASAVAAYNAAANDKSLAEAKLGEAQEQRAPIAASDQWTAVAGISNEANMAAVFDAVRDLLGL
ncbi:MAG TPA: hypothetical protein VED46_08605 [Alphaproteobacteria bacterium]|nr:hypothetical protein [Alphaproteobacteria bacterium]